jgi:hypothetical protein
MRIILLIFCILPLGTTFANSGVLQLNNGSKKIKQKIYEKPISSSRSP